MAKVIYVTGAPAAGKSTTLTALTAIVPDLFMWEYGARLTEYVKARTGAVSDQDDLRSKSALVVTPDDIAEQDRQLLAFVEGNRGAHPILIDSHPVTKEQYGYRVTAFSGDQIQKLAPDEIWVFYVSPDETQRRIERAAGGRPMVTEEEARLHTTLQASVAATYGILAFAPVYLFDTSVDRDELLERLRERLV
ncbi:MAG: AAA family ATPase [Bosea sp.]|uniref:ATP-binding protein n=1 Tax=Bosea sp. (in: a-proteobacteria) TaxID=1871050 RepID=UPI002384645F|nr:AAA family ATPase [Bosea sp. (in: a-proteobacteria)]MCP4739895.1 AAA family ATPase [Bosea sp. (in: a-proteobacteria)]